MAEQTKQARIIPIDDNYRLTFDSLNVIVQRKHVVDPTKSPAFDASKHDSAQRIEWKDAGYYSNISRALTGLLNKRIIEGSATSLREVIDEIEAFRREIDALTSL